MSYALKCVQSGPDEQPGGGFGIHTVLAAGIDGSRSKASGNLSVTACFRRTTMAFHANDKTAAQPRFRSRISSLRKSYTVLTNTRMYKNIG